MIPRRILVTGSRGFVGAHLLRRFAAEFPQAACAAPEFDVTDGAATALAVAEALPDVCVHLAGISAVTAARQDPARAWQVNLHGTLGLAQALRARVPDCLLLFASSAECYGGSFRAGTPLDERAALAPRNDYAATKAAADLALGALAVSGLRVVRLRAFNHTGPGQAPAFAVPAFAEQVARIGAGLQPPVLRVGSLEPRRDLLDVRDVAAAYAACVTHAERLEPGTVLNIASGRARRIGDVLAALLRLAGSEARVEPDPERMRPSDLPSTEGDSGLAARLIGWRPLIPWETTLRDTLRDWQRRVAGP